MYSGFGQYHIMYRDSAARPAPPEPEPASGFVLGGAVPPPPNHPRLPQTVLAGQREILVAAHLFIPQKLLCEKRMPLVVHFHGDAVARRKTMVVIHSEIMPGTCASTTETADWLLARLKLTRRTLSRPAPGPFGHARDERGPGR